MKETVQFFSKHDLKWVDFERQPPTPGELSEMKKYHYQIRTIKTAEPCKHHY